MCLNISLIIILKISHLILIVELLRSVWTVHILIIHLWLYLIVRLIHHLLRLIQNLLRNNRLI